MRSLILASLFLALSSIAGADAPRPNIIIILCDDLGYSDVGFNGATDIRTPALDRLAERGTIFTSGYVVHPFCGPSRMGLMAGRYPHVFGGQFNLPPSGLGIEEYNKQGIPVSEILISTVLQQAGYYTGAVGKWHMGIESPFHPNNRGFDDFYGFLGGGHDYFPERYRATYDRQVKAGKARFNEYIVPLEHNGKEVRETEYLTDALSQEAARFIEEAADKDQPFFLYLAYNAPHTPLQAKEEDMELYGDIADMKRRTYAAMVHAVDRGVGEVVDALKDTGAFEGTLIVFFSDNGGKTSAGATNRPLTRGKGSVFEGGYRVPMFFHWPGQVPGGQRFDHPVSALDFYPTFAGLAGAAIPEEKQLDGVDIWADFLAGRNPRQGEIIYAMRHHGSYSAVGARRDQWKITRDGTGPWMLFDIEGDISEQNDLSFQYPERLRELIAEAEEWSRTHAGPLWFHDLAARDNWEEHGMPNFEETFAVATGAASPVPSAPGKKVLAKGDSTRADFIAREKAKWEEKGWDWDRDKVEAVFDTIDANKDGIASGREKKAYWDKQK